MRSGKNQKFLCSKLSMETREEMFGTVPRVDVWFLLEYKGAWNRKAIPSSSIPKAAKERLAQYLRSTPNSRLQLIKRHQDPGGDIKFYVAASDELQPRLYEFKLNNYEDILALKIEDILSSNSFSKTEPLFLVCTHGTHDHCCGKFGVTVYLKAVSEENGFLTWQCTHLGGHRFAANLLCLPHGIYYGRVTESDIMTIASEYKSQLISLGNYRGRSCYHQVVQAADYFLRAATGIREISFFRLNSVETLAGNRSIVQFASLPGEKTYTLSIEKNTHALENYTSCADQEKSFIFQYRLIELQDSMNSTTIRR